MAMQASAAGLLVTVPAGKGWGQLLELALAFVLSALVGLEREWRNKSAGLRTHAMVGVGAALFMLISKYGFADVLAADHVRLDPSRVAAGIVTGIGFVGGGVIFVRRDAVRGLTTAAVVWVVAAVGAAAGAGLPVLAVIVTAGHFLIVFGLSPIARRLPRSGAVPVQLRLTYQDGSGALRQALEVCTRRKFTVSQVSTERSVVAGRDPTAEPGRDDRRDRQLTEAAPTAATVSVVMELYGVGSVSELVTDLTELAGILMVGGGDSAEDAGE